ncbi:MAG: metallophosphoesterase, partial [Bacteroidales bacterium]|nr:metallophosphoesterase [Bacteroidales bacterium]
MRKILIFLFLIMSVNSQAAEEKKKLVILHTNDLHSRLTGFSPESDYSPLTINNDATCGGFSRIAAILGRERSEDEEATLVLDAGDFLMGTLFQAIEPTDGFQLRLMQKMGYDAVAIGNHEFDLGPAQLARIINSSLNRGSIPQLLLGNAEFDSIDDSDNSLQELFARGVIGPWMILTRNDLRIGIFSLLGSVAAENAAFAKPVSFSKQI